MPDIITVGPDLAENVFQVHGADGTGRAVLRRKLRRAKVPEFFSQPPQYPVAMEACGGLISGLMRQVNQAMRGG